MVLQGSGPIPGPFLKRLDPTTWSKPTSRPSPTRLRGTSPRSVRLVLQRSKSPGSPTGVHWPVLKPVDVERSDLGRVQQTSDNSEGRTCLFFRRCPWPEAVHVLGAKTLEMYPRTTLSDLRHYEGQACARRSCDNVRATDDGQVKTYTCLPVMGLVPASFGDGRPAVFGSVALGVCPSDACVLRVHPRLTVGTDCCRARRHFMRGTTALSLGEPTV